MKTVELAEPDLRAWGRVLGRRAVEETAFVGLYGPLGAGKTTLVQAACEGAAVVDRVLSPSYTLIHRYQTPEGPLYHVDLYRLTSPADLYEIGWDDLLDADAPIFVEWADRAGSELPDRRWDIRLAIAREGDTRLVQMAAAGGAPEVPGPAAPRGVGA
jgi:tRNA threonylcarbamoyladenosine biosynthesis protein TsaE